MKKPQKHKKKRSFSLILIVIVAVVLFGANDSHDKTTDGFSQQQWTTEEGETEQEDHIRDLFVGKESSLGQEEEYYQFDAVWVEYTKRSKSYTLIDYTHNHYVFVSAGSTGVKKQTSYLVYDFVGNLETGLYRIDPETGERLNHYYKVEYSGGRKYIVYCSSDGSFSWAHDATLVGNENYDMEQAIELLKKTDYLKVMKG